MHIAKEEWEGCHHFFGSLFLGLIFVFVKDLGWEHEKGHVRTREDGNMESECGKRSEFFVVVCFQKGVGLWGWSMGLGDWGWLGDGSVQ